MVGRQNQHQVLRQRTQAINPSNQQHREPSAYMPAPINGRYEDAMRAVYDPRVAAAVKKFFRCWRVVQLRGVCPLEPDNLFFYSGCNKVMDHVGTNRPNQRSISDNNFKDNNRSGSGGATIGGGGQ